ncbi:MAG: 1-deoxy-D-xylulose-5-phosphate reductoisomerase [Bacteroidia bacterium]|nr:1-deoxy-D-xylulose-5-phosphate reductoisomerase [Bacteroidota bacterium]MBP9082185.1 1-deoxy-D-xylulose-5-phosphate reductoisomerase [Bacteroidia bacterium]
MEKNDKKRIALLGSTGSIGTQTLEVISEQPDHFEVEVLTANSNAVLLIEQARKFRPNTVVIGDPTLVGDVKAALEPLDIKVFAGYDAISQIVAMDSIDMVVTALVGYSGLKPTMEAIRAGKSIGLANKETLVVAGELITRLAAASAVNIFPIDSEHSAIFQCLQGEWHNPVEKIYLTASGGPFRGKTKSDLEQVTREQALKHPNWTMGAKITIDSATLMNKGLEMIEAKWLFQLRPDQIDVIVHPQSIIHSIVQFEDGSMKAQMGLPDMKLPIQFAMGYPKRMKSAFPRFDFMKYPSFTFEAPDMETFSCLQLAINSMQKGGNMPCILNAANEVAVAAFLENRIRFNGIPKLIATTMERASYIKEPTFEDYVQTDKESRILASEAI